MLPTIAADLQQLCYIVLCTLEEPVELRWVAVSEVWPGVSGRSEDVNGDDTLCPSWTKEVN